ncbi:hypothetical protein [Deinococcus hohokamensis]|uniref:Uncharacterized protein n=1 Tax=Deinococcus hohokamensis TaxID=309883 RepID=A0ABV9IBQ1_9DEIO
MTQPDPQDDTQLSESATSRTDAETTAGGQPEKGQHHTSQDSPQAAANDRPQGAHGRPSDDSDPGHS